MASPFAATPSPPYYAVVFTTTQSGGLEGYTDAAALMNELASRHPGCLGVETARSDIGITVSYWTDEQAIAAWKRNAEHTIARETGRARWCDAYVLRVAKVERDYSWRRA